MHRPLYDTKFGVNPHSKLGLCITFMASNSMIPTVRTDAHSQTICYVTNLPDSVKVAILAITKNGVQIGIRLTKLFADMTLYAPSKLNTGDTSVAWYDNATGAKIVELFRTYQGLICVFSLGAVIRLLSPVLVDKKSDPAVLVIDDSLSHVISVLSGHIGGANQLACDIAAKTGADPVITTAADVNKTIAVDLVGRDMGWVIEDDSTVTAVSAHMVNGERIGVYQDAGSANWHKGPLPPNVTAYDGINAMMKSGCKAFLIITDRVHDIPEEICKSAVIYRPPSLVAGIGLHHTTKSDTIKAGLMKCMKRYDLSPKSVFCFATMRKPVPIQGLVDAAKDMNIQIRYVDRAELSKIKAPNPSDVVKKFEGTASVSEAAAIIVSEGNLIVQKQKFPPDLTVAVARAS